MARINLLPWREELRQEKKKEYFIQLAFACIAVLLGCVFWVKSVDSAIAEQKFRNNLLNNEISLLKQRVAEIQELKKDKKELENRMRVIQDLEGKRSIIVHYLDELTKSIPDGVYLTGLERRGSSFSLQGVSESNQRIATLMRNIDGSTWFSSPNLKSVVAEPNLGSTAQTFEMDVVADLPENQKEQDDG